MKFLETFGSSLLFTLLDSAPYVVVGYFIASLIREFLPQNVLSRWLGSKGLNPLLRAVGVGCMLPICSCGIVPLGVGLVKCGASRGTTLSFMTTSPAISPVAILLGLKLLGWRFMLIYVAVVIVGAFLMGLIGNQVLPAELQQKPSRKSGYQEREAVVFAGDTGKPWWQRLTSAAHWAFYDLGAEVSLDLLFGLTLASLVISAVPAGWISQWLGGGISSIFFVIILGIPVYTCSIPSLPVVQKLMFLGASPGVAIAYLIAGPATNLGELTVILRAMGKKTCIYYGLGLLVISLAGGLIANQFLLSHSAVQGIAQTHRDQVSTELLGEASDALGQTFTQVLMARGAVELFFGVLLFVILMIGARKKLQLLFVDPCKHCQFWNDVSQDAACVGACWLKRSNTRLRRVLAIKRH